MSEDTIRRDLRELAGGRRLQRVHGGALPASPAVGDFAARQQLAPDGKVAIGRAAAKLVKAGAGGDSRWRDHDVAAGEALAAGFEADGRDAQPDDRGGVGGTSV